MQRELAVMWQRLGSRPIPSLSELPRLTDAEWQATMNVLTTLLPPALFTDENLLCLIVGRMANVSMAQGNCDGSCLAYVWLGLLLGPRFGDYRAAFQFGQLGFDLVDRGGLDRFRARVYLDYSHVVNPWMQHARTGPGLVRRALDAATSVGDLTFAAYSSCNLISAQLAAGTPLDATEREAEARLDFARRLDFGLVVDIISGQLRLIRGLRGGAQDRVALDALEQRLNEDSGTRVAIAWYWVRRLQGHVLAGETHPAADAALKVEPHLWTMPSHLEVAEFHFHAALARAAFHAEAQADERRSLLEAVRTHHGHLERWERNCRVNFEARAALVAGEIARMEGRELDAERLYERAIEAARANGFVHDEALACEVASRFHAARGLERIARAYLVDARNCYERWGATAKVRQLDALHPPARSATAHETDTFVASVERLDLATVLEVSQAVTGEHELDKLLDTVMRTAVKQAGAEGAVLLFVRGDELTIEAEAKTAGTRINVRLRGAGFVDATSLPQSIIHYVVRTGETIVLDDASAEAPFSTDPGVRVRGSRSVLCLPLVHRARPTAVLLLENNLAVGAFTPAHAAVLKVLVSLAAVSFENARLDAERQEIQEQWQAAFESNPTMYFIVDAAGIVISVNAFGAHELGYGEDELVGRSVLDIFHVEDRDAVRANAESCFSDLGRTVQWEARKIRKDGNPLWVRETARAVLLKKRPVLLVICENITERKRAEQALRDSEKELRDVIETIPAIAWTTMPDGSNSFASRRWTEYTGLSEQEAAGSGWLEVLHPDDIDLHVAKWRSSLQSGEPFENEARFRRAADGIYRWFLARAVPLRDASGNVRKWYGMAADIEDRKHAEQALRRSETYLAEAQKVSHTGSWAASPGNRNFTYLSDELIRIFGLEAGGDRKLDRDAYFQLVHPDDTAEHLAAWDRAWREKGEFSGEFRLVLRDGTVRHVHAIGHPILDQAGTLVEYVGTAVDVTERKRIEKERAANLWFLESMDRINVAMQGASDLEQMMRDVLDSVLAAFCCDRAWLIHPCDPDAASWHAVMEQTRPQFPGIFALGIDLPIDTEVAEVFRRARSAGGAVLFGPGCEFKLPEQVSKRFDIQSQMAMALHATGDKPYLFGLHQCSHARAWTAQEQRLFQEIGRRLTDSLTSLRMLRGLREGETRFRTFVDFAADAFFLSDEDGVLVDVNRQACLSLGYGRKELIGMSFGHFDLDLSETVLHQARTRLGAAAIVTFESRHRRKDGRVFPVEIRVRAFAQGRHRFRVSLARDISERKDAEAARARLEGELRRSQKMEAIGTLAGGIAHDFNNILGAILGYGELAQRKVDEGSAIQDELDQVMQAGFRGKRLVEHILAFSRTGAGQQVAVHVESVVAEALALLAASLTQGVRLEQQLVAGDAAVVGDATRLHQVVMNLCTNAVQAMPRGGVLTVRLERGEVDDSRALSHGVLEPGTYVQLAVSDTGSGIAHAALERIFDPFFTTKGVGKGTGLGLSLVHGIVGECRGAIDVATREGAGTTFTVWLPYAGETAEPSGESVAELPQGNGESVMIVDDERALVRLAEETLAQLGYDPAGFESSVEALEAFRAEPQRYELVLTDQTMPELTGTDLAREIRKLRPDVPIVLMSGYKGPQLSALAQVAGVNEILHKPLVSRDIAEALARVIAARH